MARARGQAAMIYIRVLGDGGGCSGRGVVVAAADDSGGNGLGSEAVSEEAIVAAVARQWRKRQRW